MLLRYGIVSVVAHKVGPGLSYNQVFSLIFITSFIPAAITSLQQPTHFKSCKNNGLESQMATPTATPPTLSRSNAVELLSGH